MTIKQTPSKPPTDYKVIEDATFETAAASGNPDNNNPTYLTSFAGNPAQGTGDGTPGSMYSLLAGNGDTYQINFNNNLPIGPSSQILFGDLDVGEIVTVQAFNGATQVSTDELDDAAPHR